jgi:hypothetical protein
MVTDVLARLEPDLSGRDAYVCGPPPMVDAAIPALTRLGVREDNIFYDKFTTTGEQEGEDSWTASTAGTRTPGAERPQAALHRRRGRGPEFPDSGPGARRYNYYKPAKRKQTHYEDVTVDVQPDPRHYLSQGWIYGFADGTAGYPLHWTKLKAWGVDDPEPVRGPGSGGLHVKDWPAHGWHEFRDPNEEWEMTFYRYNANVVRQTTQNVENARQAKAFDNWNPNWKVFVERNVGAWMHIEHILGLYVFAACNRSGPTNMHNTAMVVNSMHKIRFAQDLALYNLTLSEEIEGFDGTATSTRGTTPPSGRAPAGSSRRSRPSTTTGARWSSPPTWSSSR